MNILCFYFFCEWISFGWFVFDCSARSMCYVCSDERRLIERFQNSEKFYIQLLKNAATTYLHDLPDDLRATLTVFLDTSDKIIKFHADTFYPKLLQCEMKIITICDMIKTHLDHNEFSIYFTYAAYVHEALHMIQSFYLNAVRHFDCKFCACIAFIVAFVFYSVGGFLLCICLSGYLVLLSIFHCMAHLVHHFLLFWWWRHSMLFTLFIFTLSNVHFYGVLSKVHNSIYLYSLVYRTWHLSNKVWFAWKYTLNISSILWWYGMVVCARVCSSAEKRNALNFHWIFLLRICFFSTLFVHFL